MDQKIRPTRDFDSEEIFRGADVSFILQAVEYALMNQKIRPTRDFDLEEAFRSADVLSILQATECELINQKIRWDKMKKLPAEINSEGRYFQRNQASLFSFKVMLLFFRAALFLCRRPFNTA